jgi:hypothetical protein
MIGGRILDKIPDYKTDEEREKQYKAAEAEQLRLDDKCKNEAGDRRLKLIFETKFCIIITLILSFCGFKYGWGNRILPTFIIFLCITIMLIVGVIKGEK